MVWSGRPAADGSGDVVLQFGERHLHAELGPRASWTADARPIALLVSPARRARQTVAPITAAFGVEAVVEADLVEVDVGEAEGFDWPTLARRFPEVAAAIGQGIQPDWPGGETHADVARRATRAVESIRAMATAEYDITSYQPVLFAAASFDELEDVVGGFFTEVDDGRPGDRGRAWRHPPRHRRPADRRRPSPAGTGTRGVAAPGP